MSTSENTESSFGSERPFSVGVEEELFLVDPVTGSQANASSAVQARLGPVKGTVERELHACQVELITDVCRSAGEAVQTLSELLSGSPGWAPPRLDGTTVVAQPHCHHSAVMGWDADAALLQRAGAELTRLGGCCGLAGNFGMERGHYDVSAAVAGTALLPAVSSAAPDAVVLADGFSCRTQLTDLSGRSGVHLAQLLAGRLDPAL